MLREVKHDRLNISVWSVYLVDCYNQWDVHALGQLDYLNSLLLHTFDGRDNQDDHIGDFGSPGTHVDESFVPWSVDESNLILDTLHPICDLLTALAGFHLGCIVFAVAQALVLDREGSDRLRDSTELFGAFVVVCAERVEQRCLSVIDVAHDGDDRRPCHISFTAVAHLIFVHQLDIDVILHAY